MSGLFPICLGIKRNSQNMILFRTKVLKFQVLVTTYEVAMIEYKRLSAIAWQYLVVDEGHRIKVR